MGKASEVLVSLPAGGSPIVPDSMKGSEVPCSGNVLVPANLAGHGVPGLKVIPDGNRGALLPDHRTVIKDREYIISIKGVGARRPMYENPPWESTSLEPYPFSCESWFGENPWGAMSGTACWEDAAITDLADGSSIQGFHICPMLRAEPLPEEIMERAMSNHWYRRLDDPGPFYQEFRAVPSDVRLYYQSSSTLGDNVQGVLDSFGVTDVEVLDDLLDNFIRSGIAALTLGARTMQRSGGAFRMLDYHDVWLDKDSVIAPDGTLFFADIEGLDWTRMLDEGDAAKVMRTQFHRNYYEFMYGLDRLIRCRERMRGRELSWPARRAGTAAVFEMTLSDDPFLELVHGGSSLGIRLSPGLGMDDVEMKLIDLGG
ncbi:MAG: hypothetical protein ACMUHY_08015 [Thermoplasmatota archaeon]